MPKPRKSAAPSTQKIRSSMGRLQPFQRLKHRLDLHQGSIRVAGRTHKEIIKIEAFGRQAKWVAVPATMYQVINRPPISAPGRVLPVRRQV